MKFEHLRTDWSYQRKPTEIEIIATIYVTREHINNGSVRGDSFDLALELAIAESIGQNWSVDVELETVKIKSRNGRWEYVYTYDYPDNLSPREVALKLYSTTEWF